MWIQRTCILTCCALTAGCSRLLTVPTVRSNSTNGILMVNGLRNILVDGRYSNHTDVLGQTTIPPTLYQFAETFVQDAAAVLQVSLTLSVAEDVQGSVEGTVILTLDQNVGSYRDAAGRKTSEGYTLDLQTRSVIIHGSSPLGVWWGTRTLLQLAVLGAGKIETGLIKDAPGWGTRGVMLDVARHYYPPSFLSDICSYLSFFKQNTFHLHLSDNLIVNPAANNWDYDSTVYAAFRLELPQGGLAGLSTHTNETYSLATFDMLQRRCARRGVTILPEIESPGHSLVINKWKPELALSSDLTLLNISHPSTMPTMKSIWSAALPHLHSKTVHIGGDEYDPNLIDEFNHYINSLVDYIGTQSGKSACIWGLYPVMPDVVPISKSICYQHWGELPGYPLSANPLHDYVANGYSVINSDSALYIVNKYSHLFPQTLNETVIFNGDPSGGQFAPNIFDTQNTSNNPRRDEPLILGHLAGLWNDQGPNATVYSEAYFALRDWLPALADKQWGGTIAREEYSSVFDILHAAIPDQNLDMAIPSVSSSIVRYQFDNCGHSPIGFLDRSGNKHHAINHGCSCNATDGSIIFDGSCYLSTPNEAQGRSYSLSFDVWPNSAKPGSLFANIESDLRHGNGTTTNITFISGGTAYPLNYSLPPETWTRMDIRGIGNRSFLQVDDEPTMEFTIRLGIGETLTSAWVGIALPAPFRTIGRGFEGRMKNIALSSISSQLP